MTQPRITITDDPAAAAAEKIAAVARARGHIALAGGRTPRAAYEQAAALVEDWSGVTLWFGDDRAVGPNDERSNYRLAREALLDRIAGPAPVVHRIHGEEGYEAAAGAYAETLRAVFGEGVPALDLILLGIGGDGHTASLFPGTPALAVTDQPVVGVPEPGLEPFVPRITFTFPALNAAREVVFLIEGEGKAEAVRRAFGSPPDPAAPSAHVRPDPGTLTVLLDPPAAAQLEGPA